MKKQTPTKLQIEEALVAKALMESENRMRVFIEHAPAALAMFDKDMRYLSYSNRWLKDFSLEGQNIHGKYYSEVFPEVSDDWKTVHQRAMLGEILERDEDKFLRLDGTIQWKHWEMRPWLDADGQVGGIVVLSEDITKRVSIREELKTLNADLERKVTDRTAELEASNKELEAFSYSVSHDLRAPLRHLNGYVDLLNQKFKDDLPEKARNYLDTISDAANQMGLLIDDLLRLSKTGRQKIKAELVDMNELVSIVLVRFKPDVTKRKIKWTIHDLPNVTGDKSLLKQVWVNLIDNAIKYTRNKAKAEIEIGSKKETKSMVFFIRDNGVGFDMKYATKLFGVFQRIHSPSDFEGTGIGLANVQRIIRKHHGKVWAEAAIDKGATFYFSIPD